MFRGLDDCDSDSSSDLSSSEDDQNLKRKVLTKKVLELKNQLEREEKQVSEEGATEERQPDEEQKSERTGTKICEKVREIPLSVEDYKLANQRLQDEQVLLKRNLRQSIREGDIAEAETLSDVISAKELEFRANKAAIVEDYLNRTREKDEQKAKKRRKKLHWVFETKKKWETKSNM